MNERIRELVGQAKFMAEETINKQISKNEELDAFAEKFAELIVRECIEVVKWTPSQFPNGECVKNIKEHFGVKE